MNENETLEPSKQPAKADKISCQISAFEGKSVQVNQP